MMNFGGPGCRLRQVSKRMKQKHSTATVLVFHLNCWNWPNREIRLYETAWHFGPLTFKVFYV